MKYIASQKVYYYIMSKKEDRMLSWKIVGTIIVFLAAIAAVGIFYVRF